MKIFAISASTIPSESANSIQTMKAVHALAQLGHEITLIVPQTSQSSKNYSWIELAAFYGLTIPFTIEWLPLKNRRMFGWHAVRKIRNADVIYTWVSQAAVFSLVRRIPVIIEIHDLPSGRIGPWWHRAFLRLPGLKRTLVITNALKRSLEAAYGEHLRPADVILAPNGIEPERFVDLPSPELARREIGISEIPTVACTGHLYAGRGADVFLSLAQVIPEAQFLWAGGKPADVDLWKSRADKMELRNVFFTGFIRNNELPLYQAAAEILLMPYGRDIGISSGGGNSAAISSPMKMFEYLAAGRAIVTSNLSVFHEVLNERNAVFCPPDDVPAWVEAVRDLLANPEKRELLSRQAKADSAQYSWTERARRALTNFP
jgi:glycosyltransferase involved in cell wall biosynthesis